MTAPPEPTFVDDRLAHWAEHTPDATAFTYGERTLDVVAVGGPRAPLRRRPAGSWGSGAATWSRSSTRTTRPASSSPSPPSSLGAANAIVNWRSAGDEVDYAVNDSGATVLLVGSELMPLVESIRDRLTNVEHVIEVTPDGADGDAYEAWLAAAPRATRSPTSSPATPAWSCTPPAPPAGPRA